MLGVSGYNQDQIDFESISQIIAFQDDSLEISFRDRSVIQLSPCGANFKYTRPPRLRVDPALAKSLQEITQRCVFATSETSKKVTQAILIRNQICSNPYLPEEFLVHQTNRETFQLYKDIEVFEWPNQTQKCIPSSCASESENDHMLCSHSDGRVTVTCKQNYAKLTLLPDGHRVHARYVAKVSEKKVGSSLRLSEESKTNLKTFMWQERVFPVFDCPCEWKCALDILTKMLPESADEKPVFSIVPPTTPESCPRQFTHDWRSTLGYCNEEVNDLSSDVVLPFSDDPAHKSAGKLNIKLLWNNNTTFWITHCQNADTCQTVKTSVEVWFPDGSIFKSDPTSERYLIHMIPSYVDQGLPVKFDKRTVLVTALPHQDLKLKSVMLRSIRLLSYCRQAATTLSSDSRCWKIDLENNKFLSEANSDSSAPTNLDNDSVHEKVSVPDLGTFSAINDSIQILFKDDSMLHMTLNIPELRSGASLDLANLTKDQCRVILANGRYYSVTDMTHPPWDITSYVESAVNWVRWVIKPVGERRKNPFYTDTIHDPSKRDLISHELDKIKRFNYISSKELEKKLPEQDSSEQDVPYMELIKRSSLRHRSTEANTASSQLCVSQALKSTSKAIDDLDSVIQSLRGRNGL